MHLRFVLLLMLAAAQPREKARELLDEASQLLGASPPHIQVIALMDLGATYRLFDKEKSAACLRDAFAATATVPEEDGRNFRTRFQGEIVKRLAEVSVTDACAMLRAMAEPGKDGGSGSATRNVVDYLLARERPDFDRSIEVVNLAPPAAEYPFDAAGRILAKLPAGDSRRAIVFGNALAAYKKRPEGTAFPQVLAAHWRGLPADSARSAVAEVVQAISDRVEDPGSGEAGFSANEEGTKVAGSRKAKDLIELIHVVREVDPKRAKELLVKYPELATAPKPKSGEESSGTDDEDDPSDIVMPLIPFHGSMDIAAMQREVRDFDQVSKKADAAVRMLEKNPDQALSLAAEMPPRFRASLLARLARNAAGGKDPSLAERLLSDGVKALQDVKEPADRALPWATLAEAAHKLKNDKLALDALDHALDDVAEVYTQDTDADSPNVAFPEHWPGIQGCRLITWSAVRALGVAAEPLLAGIRNKDLALIAHVEMARALVNEPRREWSIQWVHTLK